MRLITGKGNFSDDVRWQGQTYAIFVRSPHAHARILNIDVQRAFKIPGVLTVLTGRDLLADGLKPLPHEPAETRHSDLQVGNRDGVEPFVSRQYPLTPDTVRCIGEPVAVVIAESVAARRVGRPVKWTCERSEAFITDYQGRDLTVTAELALDAAGNFLAMRGTNRINLGAHTVQFGMLKKGLAIMSSTYRVPAAHFQGYATMSNTLPTRAYRSAGRPEVMFVMERLIDLAARQCNFDRIELRRRNLLTEAELPYANQFGMTYDSGAYHTAMESALKLADWQEYEARRAEARERGKRRGIGIANYVDTSTGAPRERSDITVLPDGKVEVVLGIVSQGQGHETVFAQLVSEWLGVACDYRTARWSGAGDVRLGRDRAACESRTIEGTGGYQPAAVRAFSRFADRSGVGSAGLSVCRDVRNFRACQNPRCSYKSTEPGDRTATGTCGSEGAVQQFRIRSCRQFVSGVCGNHQV